MKVVNLGGLFRNVRLSGVATPGPPRDQKTPRIQEFFTWITNEMDDSHELPG